MLLLLSSPVFSKYGPWRRERPITGLLPQAKPSEERIGVVARPASSRQFFQFLDVASSQNYVIGLEGGNQAGNHVRDMSPPLLFAPLLQSSKAYVILVGRPFIRKVSQ